MAHYSQSQNKHPSVSIGTSASGAPAISSTGPGTMSSLTVNTTSNYSVEFNNPSGVEKGSIRFNTSTGNIEAHDGNNWVIISGLESPQQNLNEIINALVQDYPEIAADFILRGLISE